MNPLLNEYERHYVEAHKNALKAIKHINSFREHYVQLYDNDKKQLFEQIITELALRDLCDQLWRLMCNGNVH